MNGQSVVERIRPERLVAILRRVEDVDAPVVSPGLVAAQRTRISARRGAS